MTIDLKGRSFLTLLDFTSDELKYLLDLSLQLKAAKKNGTEKPKLIGKNIALIFEKTSTRTRCAFEVAAYDQGANVTYLGPTGTQIGNKESIKDTARVLGRMYDGIQYRGFSQKTVEILAEHADVPVWNGLTDEFHPTQVLADFMTMLENVDKPLNQVKFAYIGDARNNMGNSLMVGAAKMGIDFRSIAPEKLQTSREIFESAKDIASKSGARLIVTESIKNGIKDCDFLYTDVWVSMGESESVWKERINLLTPYRINRRVIELTGNLYVKFMHCLPAFHNRETEIGEEVYKKFGIDCMEVTDDVFESDASVVFDQAENRLHTIKAIMMATICNRE